MMVGRQMTSGWLRRMVVAWSICALTLSLVVREVVAQNLASTPLWGGTLFRILTPKQGAVRVWIPPDYDRATAGVVIYLHDYNTTADLAWRDHQLAEQFLASGQNAMFVIPESPASADEPVIWPSLRELQSAIRKGGVRVPEGAHLVIAHGGGARTAAMWIKHPALLQLILLDPYDTPRNIWLPFAKHPMRRMTWLADDGADEPTNVSNDGASEQAIAVAKRYGFVVRRTWPDLDASDDVIAMISRTEKNARLLFAGTPMGHVELVSEGRIIPVLLRLSPLLKSRPPTEVARESPRVPDEDRARDPDPDKADEARATE